MLKKILGLVFLFIVHSLWFIAPLALAQEESITFTTYYPSPYGSYNALGTNKLAVDINGVAVPSEYDAMQNGDAHVGRALIVGSGGGSGFAFDELIGPPDVRPGDGDVLIKGKVGIGTTSPGAKLEVNGNIRLNVYDGAKSLTFYQVRNDQEGSVVWAKDTSPFATAAQITSVAYGSYGRKGLAFYTGNNTDFSTTATEAMRIDNLGNVGIGTAPASALHVSGGIRSKRGLPDPGAAGNSSNVGYSFGLDGDTGMFRTAGIDDGTGGDIAFYLDVVEFMRIKNNLSGTVNVGIGTTSPGSLNSRQSVLQIGKTDGSAGLVLAHDGTGTADSWELMTSGGKDAGNFSIFRDTTEYLAMTRAGNIYMAHNGGNVGIGTTAPQGALDVVSTTGAFIVPRMTTAQRDALTAMNGMIIYNTTTNQFNFRENGAWVLK
jgi:hypothetical protein